MSRFNRPRQEFKGWQNARAAFLTGCSPFHQHGCPSSCKRVFGSFIQFYTCATSLKFRRMKATFRPLCCVAVLVLPETFIHYHPKFFRYVDAMTKRRQPSSTPSLATVPIATKTPHRRAAITARLFLCYRANLTALTYALFSPTCRYLSCLLVTGATDCTTASRHAARGAPRLLSGLDLRW